MSCFELFSLGSPNLKSVKVSGIFRDPPIMGPPYPYYSHTTPIRIPKDLGIVWETYHKGASHYWEPLESRKSKLAPLKTESKRFWKLMVGSDESCYFKTWVCFLGDFFAFYHGKSPFAPPFGKRCLELLPDIVARQIQEKGPISGEKIVIFWGGVAYPSPSPSWWAPLCTSVFSGILWTPWSSIKLPAMPCLNRLPGY